jgi:TPR repeat protein
MLYAKKAADAGESAAQCNYGLALFEGRDVSMNKTEAIKYIIKSAKMGFVKAQIFLGSLFSGASDENGVPLNRGTGISINHKVAFSYFKQAADAGDPEGEFNVAISYGEGLGVEKDMTQAVAYWTKSAEKGFPPSMFNVGYSYAEGTGVRVDKEEAVKWYKLSAEAGVPLGQFHYGNALFKGEGVRVDEEAGLRWVKKAADNGVDVGYVYERLN